MITLMLSLTQLLFVFHSLKLYYSLVKLTGKNSTTVCTFNFRSVKIVMAHVYASPIKHFTLICCAPATSFKVH